MLGFVQRLIAIRKRFSALYTQQFIHQQASSHGAGLSWFCRNGEPMTKVLWSDAHTRSLSLVLTGGNPSEPSQQQALLLMLNADEQALVFTAPDIEGFESWQCLLHTQSIDAESAQSMDVESWQVEPTVQSELPLSAVVSASSAAHNACPTYPLKDRSLMLFSAQLKGSTP